MVMAACTAPAVLRTASMFVPRVTMRKHTSQPRGMSWDCLVLALRNVKAPITLRRTGTASTTQM